MKKKILYSLLVLFAFTLSGCGEEDEGGATSSASTQGWHFQGRDCLACHNVDLNPDKHLLVAGTLYKSSSVQDVDDTNEMCGGEVVINFYDATNPSNLLFSSTPYKDVASKGYKGKGNLFILQRALGIISSGDYYLELATPNGQVLADKTFHSFSAEAYDINSPVDYSNRLSCNACHSPAQGAPKNPIYVKASAVSLCE